MTYKEKKERLLALITEQRSYIDANKELDLEKDEPYQKREADINRLQLEVQTEKRYADIEASLNDTSQVRSENVSEGPGGVSAGSTREPDSDVQWRAFVKAIRGSREFDAAEKRALEAGVDAEGGFTVPTTVSNQIVQDLTPLSTVRSSGAAVVRGVHLHRVPVINDGTAAFVAEEGVIGDQSPSFGNFTFAPELLISRVPISWQLLRRAANDIQADLRRSMARSIADKEDEKFLVGTGTLEPEGIVTGSSLGKAAASPTAVTEDEINDLWYSLDQRRRNRAAWYMSSSMASKIRNLKESGSGRPIWVQSLQDGEGLLHQRPVFINDFVPAPTTGNKSLIVGDPDEYKIGEEGATEFKVNEFELMSNGQVVLYLYRFVDGRVARSAGFKHLLQA